MDFVHRLFTHTAGVNYDQGGLFRAGHRVIIGHLQKGIHPLAVIDIHLAAVSGYINTFFEWHSASYVAKRIKKNMMTCSVLNR